MTDEEIVTVLPEHDVENKDEPWFVPQTLVIDVIRAVRDEDGQYLPAPGAHVRRLPIGDITAWLMLSGDVDRFSFLGPGQPYRAVLIDTAQEDLEVDLAVGITHDPSLSDE